MERNIFEDYTRQYSLSKTLRFSLIPQGKTLEYIEKKGILTEDEERAENYKVVKKMIDEYHKTFMEKALKGLQLTGLEEYYSIYKSSNRDEKAFKNVESSLRKQVVAVFKKEKDFETLLKPGIMIQELSEKVNDTEEQAVIESFQCFSTYFQGFFENRRNMYTDEEKSTAVSYRIVNQNLPKFIDNMRVFEIIMSTELCMDIARFEKEISELLNGRKIEDFFRLENYAGTVTHTAIEFYNLLIGGRTLENGSQIKGINQYVNDFNQKNSKNKEVRKIPKLKVLYKQILADRETLSFVDEQFEDDQTVIDTINSVVKDIYDKVIRNDAENSFAKLFGNIANYDLDKIYIANGQAMTNLSNAVLGDWALIKRCIEQEYDELNAKKAKNEKYFDTRSATLKKQGSYSIGRLNELVHKYSDKKECLESYYVSLGKRAVAQGEEENLLDTFEKAYTKAEELLNSDYSSKHGLASDKKNVAVLKQLLDSVKAIEEFVKPLFGTKTEKEKDDAFYGELDLVYKTLEQIVMLYHKS